MRQGVSCNMNFEAIPPLGLGTCRIRVEVGSVKAAANFQVHPIMDVGQSRYTGQTRGMANQKDRSPPINKLRCRLAPSRRLAQAG